ncbi:MAG: hypothetical protein K8U57_03535 [Planctomycetes bacterium]|nr:hypothetical protein [Planctomycetota bacterium]
MNDSQMTAYPPLPELPAGSTLTHLGVYRWSEPPTPQAMARGADGTLLVCEWNKARKTWRAWKPNELL